MTEHPRGVHQPPALGQKGAARQHVDVGIEHQGQHQHHAAGGADREEQAEVVTEPAPQGRLHGAGEIHDADGDEGQHIGGNREGEHQCPVEQPSAGKLAEAGKPGQTDAKQYYPRANAEHQDHCVVDQPQHLRLQQMPPDLSVQALPAEYQNQQGHQHQRRGQIGHNPPAGHIGDRTLGHSHSANQKLKRPASSRAGSISGKPPGGFPLLVLLQP